MGDKNATNYRLVVMGDGAVGKSCLTLQFTRKQFIEDYDPTIEDAYRKSWDVDGHNVTLDILDTAGQEEYDSMRAFHIQGGAGFVCVYSITSMDSYKRIITILKEIRRLKDKERFPTILVGNKADLEDKREVETELGQQLADEFNTDFLETSAKHGQNVDEVFVLLVRFIRNETGWQPRKSKPFGVCVLL